MNWLVTIGLTNALVAMLLAAIAWIVARCWRQPALAHLLWVVVLLKLFTPSLLEIPVGWKLDVTSVLPSSREVVEQPATGQMPEYAFDGISAMVSAPQKEPVAKHES